MSNEHSFLFSLTGPQPIQKGIGIGKQLVWAELVFHNLLQEMDGTQVPTSNMSKPRDHHP